MAPLKFISLSVGSLLLLRATQAIGTPNEHKPKDGNCLQEFNAARNTVGFPGYTEAQEQAFSAQTDLDAVCKAINENDGTGATSVQPGYNFIYVVQEDDSCSKLVTTINAAFEKIGTSLPPVYNSTSRDPVYTQQTINFMALYNPVTAVVSCSSVTCKKAEENMEQRRRLSAQAPIKAMACSVKPGTIENGHAPYNQEQYNKILAVFAPSSASAAVPTFLALAAAAAGIAFM